jgi:hypothetical protein
VGTSATETIATETSQFNAQLPIKTGDYLGVDNANSALIFAPTAGASIYEWNPQLVDGSNRGPGAVRGTLELMVQADVEPDVDCDGRGDETQDPNTADGPCAPHGGGGGGGIADVVAPTFSKIAVTPRKPRARKTAKLGYTVSEAARVVFTFDRKLSGRRSGASCVKTTKANRRSKHCTRFALSGTLSQNATAGKNAVGFKVKKPGSYRVTLVGTDAAGNVSLPRRASFRARPRRG